MHTMSRQGTKIDSDRCLVGLLSVRLSSTRIRGSGSSIFPRSPAGANTGGAQAPFLLQALGMYRRADDLLKGRLEDTLHLMHVPVF